MKELDTLAQIYSKSSFRELKNLIDGANLVLHWGKIIDEPIASQTEALKFYKGIIYVETASSVWANELTYLKKELIEKLNRRFDKPVVKDIKFLVKGVKYGKGRKKSG